MTLTGPAAIHGNSTAAAASTEALAAHPARSALMIGALGVVFGDIGTSPIYAFRESIKASGQPGNELVVFGVLSLVFWAVILVVALKYVLIVMRADNQGEGGTMALLSLALPAAGPLRNVLLIVGLGGASLFFGDAMITPAISVLSAVEGVEIVTPLLKPYVVPLAAVVLVGLFLIQSHGSGRVGRFFGPVMVLWFALLALAGVWNIRLHPEVLAALDPRYAIGFLGHANGWVAFTVLGSVFLALTGGEALYADMGHFRASRDPDRLVRVRVAGTGAELPRSGRTRPVEPGRRGKPVLPARARAAPDPGRDPHDLRHRDRQPGGDLGRVRARAAGDPARRPAAAGGEADLGGDGRAGVRAADQLAPRRRGAHAGVRLPQLGRTRQRVWHRGGRRHARHHDPGRHRGARRLGLVLADRRARGEPSSSSSTLPSSPRTRTRSRMAAGFRCSSAPSL